MDLPPQEIWLLITDKVTDSSSLDSLIHASPVFRNLLLPRRVEFLFPQVWKVLGVKFEKEEEEVYSYKVDKVYPDRDLSRFKYGETPWFTKILTLPLVCKNWCEGVDEFYQNLPDSHHYRMEMDEFEMDEHHLRGSDKWSREHRRMGNWIHNEYVRDLNEKADKFVAHFDPTHFEGGNQTSSIISRHIYIDHSCRYPSAGFFSVLSKYGQHFWFCDLSLHDEFRTRVAFYTYLKKMLCLLPNLKILKVKYTRGEKFVRWKGFVNTQPSNLEIAHMDQVIASHPLPTLHQLEFLSVRKFPASIFNALLSENTHISMLEVERDDFQQGYDIYSFPMPNLKQLSMKYFYKIEFENLNNAEVNWALEKIYFNFKFCDFMRWSEIFSLLEKKWATTLKNVAIHFPPIPKDGRHVNVKDDGSSTTLNLPKVQRFSFTSREIFCLDFMLPMKSLQCLEVGLVKINQNDPIDKQLRLLENKQVVQFVGFFKNLEKSNIWSIFPNLKSYRLGDADWEGTCQTNGCWSNGKRSVRYGSSIIGGPRFMDLWLN